MKLRQKTTLIILALIIAFGLVFFSLGESYAAHGLSPIFPRLFPGPFGGKIHNITSCNCPVPYGKLIEVGPPLGGSSFFIAGGVLNVLGAFGIPTQIFRHKKIEEGQWILGNSKLIPIPCEQWAICGIPPFASPCCKNKGVGWYVDKIGTSNIR